MAVSGNYLHQPFFRYVQRAIRRGAEDMKPIFEIAVPLTQLVPTRSLLQTERWTPILGLNAFLLESARMHRLFPTNMVAHVSQSKQVRLYTTIDAFISVLY